jgi:electron transport complex protein RnfC
MHVEPWLIEKLVEQKRWEDAEREKIMLCAECGSCSYICPASRPLLDYIRLGKSTLLRLRRERSKK